MSLLKTTVFSEVYKKEAVLFS